MSDFTYRFYPTSTRVFLSLLQRFFLLILRNKASYLTAILFYLVVITTFHLAIGPYEVLPLVSVGIIIVVQVFALILDAARLLREDYKLTILEQFFILGVGLETIILAKLLGFFLLYGLSSLILIPLGMVFFNIDMSLLPSLLSASFLTIINCSLVIMFCEALTLYAKSQMLLIILVLPLLVPAIILATLGVQQSYYLVLLLGITLFSLPIFVIGTKAAIKAVFSSM